MRMPFISYITKFSEMNSEFNFPYDKEKYKEMILDAAETVLGFLALTGVVTAILTNQRIFDWLDQTFQKKEVIESRIIKI
jgi:uncharacterized membrane protein